MENEEIEYKLFTLWNFIGIKTPAFFLLKYKIINENGITKIKII